MGEVIGNFKVIGATPVRPGGSTICPGGVC